MLSAKTDGHEHKQARENILKAKNIPFFHCRQKIFQTLGKIEKMLFIVTINSKFHLSVDKSPTYLIYSHCFNKNFRHV